jgi:hypothetical protein
MILLSGKDDLQTIHGLLQCNYFSYKEEIVRRIRGGKFEFCISDPFSLSITLRLV